MKLSDFFIGVIEFFSVILPGALITFFLAGMFYEDVFGAGKVFPVPESEAAKWAVFLVLSYLFGNLIFMIATLLDLTYDSVLRKRLFQTSSDLTYKTACLLQRRHIDADRVLADLFLCGDLSSAQYDDLRRRERPEIFNTFKWSQHYLFFRNENALASIHRVEADSKFFRSLVVAFLVIGGVLLYRHSDGTGLIVIVAAALCYYRYGELRYKSTQKAYEIVITGNFLDPMEPAVAVSETGNQPAAADEKPTRDELPERHRDKVRTLTRGLSGNYDYLAVPPGGSRTLDAETGREIYCLQGSAFIDGDSPDASRDRRISQNSITPVAKGSKLSIVNRGSDPADVLIFRK